MPEGVRENPERRAFRESFLGMSEEAVVRAELISRFADAFVKGSYLYAELEFDQWMGILKQAKVQNRTINTYKARADRVIEAVSKKLPAAGVLYERRANRAIVKDARQYAEELFAVVSHDHFKKGVDRYFTLLYERAQAKNSIGEKAINHLVTRLQIAGKDQAFDQTDEHPELHGKPFVTCDINPGYGFPDNVVLSFLRQGPVAAAQFLKRNSSVAGIFINSWIVGAYPSLVERLGFTILYVKRIEPTTGLRVTDKSIFVTRAFMTRDTCIRKYG